MSVKKTRKMTTLLQRDISRMISINTQIPVTEVELMFKSLSEILILAVDRGYTVNLPASIAQVVPRVREAHKEGDIVPVYGTMVTTQEEIDKHNKQPDRETDMYFGEDGIIYAKFISDPLS